MIEMVLVYCMIGDPAQCIEQRPVFEDPLTAMACMMSAQTVAVEYVRDHPNWTLSGWRCEMNKPRSEPT
jgi:hypothetical protein